MVSNEKTLSLSKSELNEFKLTLRTSSIIIVYYLFSVGILKPEQ